MHTSTVSRGKGAKMWGELKKGQLNKEVGSCVLRPKQRGREIRIPSRVGETGQGGDAALETAQVALWTSAAC